MSKVIVAHCGTSVLVDDEDYEKFSRFKWYLRAHRNNTYHTVIRNVPLTNGKKSFLAREIMGVTDGSILVDHINGNPLDNRRSNLRTCNKSQNSCNRGAPRTNKLDLKGVRKIDGRYMAQICKNQKGFYLGLFSTPEEAHEAYKAAARVLHGEFACNGGVLSEAQ
jgi:hypothetical protein